MQSFNKLAAAFVARLALAAVPLSFAGTQDDKWPFYGHDCAGQRFSPLAAIHRQNVGLLQIAWAYRTGDGNQPEPGRAVAFQCAPLYIDDKLYLATPLGHVIAHDPLPGKALWSYDANVSRGKGYGSIANRGVSV